MDSKEFDFRLQIFQDCISTLYMYPICLYKNTLFEDFINLVGDDFEDVYHRIFPNSYYNPKEALEKIQRLIKENPKFLSDELFNNLNRYSSKLNKLMWHTKPSNSLTFTEYIKDNKKLWLYLFIYNIFTKDFIDTEFKNYYSRDCLIGMRQIFLKLNEDFTILIGRVFTKEQDIDSIIRNLLEQYDFDDLNIFELTKLAKKRRLYDGEILENKANEIKRAFKIFLDHISSLPEDISKDELEKFSIFIFMISRNRYKEDIEVKTPSLILRYIDDKFEVLINRDKKSYYPSDFKQAIRKFENYQSFFLEEYTSKIKTTIAKKYSTFKYEYITPVNELIKEVCTKLQATGSCYIQYDVSSGKLKSLAEYGDSEYIAGIKRNIDIINNQNPQLKSKSRTVKVIENYNSDKYKYDISHLILFNIEREKTLHPVEGKPLYSNIAIPVTFRHKLLGVLLIDSFRKNNFTENDIELAISISNALSVQIYDQIVETNLFKILQSTPNQAELQDNEALQKRFEKLTSYMNNIFFSYGVSIWQYDKDGKKFILKSTTLKVKDRRDIIIYEDSDDLINELVLKFNRSDFKYLKDFDIKHHNRLLTYNPTQIDSRINCIKIYPIKDGDKLLGAFSIYNAYEKDYKAIDEQSLASVHDHLQIFFNIINTFRRQRELIHSHALHDISSRLNMIDSKITQLRELLFAQFKDIDPFSRSRFNVKLNDIEDFTNNIRLSFNFIANKSDTYRYTNPVDDEIDNLYKLAMRNNKKVNNIRHIFNELINSMPFPYDRKNLMIKNLVDPKINLFIHNLILSDLFQNLFINALKYSFQGTTITITSKISSNAIQINIKNEGLRINHDEYDDIFNYGYRSLNAKNFSEKIAGNHISYKAKENENLGIGLYKAKEIVSKVISGEINFRSEKSNIKDGDVNIFEIVFPIALYKKG